MILVKVYLRSAANTTRTGQTSLLKVSYWHIGWLTTMDACRHQDTVKFPSHVDSEACLVRLLTFPSLLFSPSNFHEFNLTIDQRKGFNYTRTSLDTRV